jgi:ABC-type multidrug transport system fused ATPase/permease subunit
MFNLIERFYDPDDGFIAINGTDIKKYTLNSLRKNISEVSQDVFLFNDTVEANIKYGAPNASHDAVVAAARAANAHDFITAFPHGYETCVGEGGALLSGGQKQRIAIARAILKDAPILLLDEATSALDSISENLIQEAINPLIESRTSILIAHRLSTILAADEILVVRDGEIVERGQHHELVHAGGTYQELYETQFSKALEDDA